MTSVKISDPQAGMVFQPEEPNLPPPAQPRPTHIWKIRTRARFKNGMSILASHYILKRKKKLKFSDFFGCFEMALVR